MGLILNQNTIYKFFEEEFNIRWKDIIPKRMLPDNSLFLTEAKQFFVFEIKNQNVAGSVDEKLQTWDFKKKQWEKLMKKIKFSIHYVYLLSPWFQKNEYEDTRKYIKSVGCDFLYSNLSLKSLGLPEQWTLKPKFYRVPTVLSRTSWLIIKFKNVTVLVQEKSEESFLKMFHVFCRSQPTQNARHHTPLKQFRLTTKKRESASIKMHPTDTSKGFLKLNNYQK